MTYPAHTEVVLVRLREGASLANKTHDSTAKKTDAGELIRDNYCIVYSDPYGLEQTRLSATQRQSRRSDEITVRSVGIDPGACRAIAMDVDNQLLGFIPQVPGRRFEPIRFEDSSELRDDNAVSPPLFYVDVTYLVMSDPA